MTSGAAEIHVVSKEDNSQKSCIALPSDSSSLNTPLAPSSIRVRTDLISLTANNLSYARGGSFLHWWDAYPVPPSAPAPFNDDTRYGIVPAWGYAVVLESTTSIPPGARVWGFWPTSTWPTDLKLKAAEPAGHWIEMSEHRRQLMNAYQRYVVTETQTEVKEEVELMAWNAIFRPVWEGSYLISRYVFSDGETHPALHPTGMGDAWNATDADLSSALVISLSASCKTARSFAWLLSHARVPSAGPVALLQVTSSPSSVSSDSSSFPSKTISYASISEPETLEWIANRKSSRVVIVDFGARRADSLERLLDALQRRSLPALAPTIITVGSEAKVYTPEELQAYMESGPRLGKIQLNTSGLRDIAMKLQGEEDYFGELNATWDRWLDDEGPGGMKIVWGRGLGGDQGVEGGWKKLCDGRTVADEGLVFQL
ncbi:MAG: hypothetical protein M1816_000513 [Peltula sp. TS41687]|nr:MAG: hypothetical protein M1816_000513 [Peltula sp. TS41687]